MVKDDRCLFIFLNVGGTVEHHCFIFIFRVYSIIIIKYETHILCQGHLRHVHSIFTHVRPICDFEKIVFKYLGPICVRCHKVVHICKF